MRRIKYIQGEKIGEAYFIRRTNVMPNGQWKALFLCRCGNEFETSIAKVKSLHTKSCGCVDLARKTIHGMSKGRDYCIWENMKSRCFNINSNRYARYGGRGITIYSEWVNNPKTFIDYIKSLPRYGVKGLTLDRINNDGNYEPGNLRWTTYSIQNSNRARYKWGKNDKL